MDLLLGTKVRKRQYEVHTVTLASAGRGARPKRKLTAIARESWTIESSSSRRQQPNSERRTRSSTHTVNLPLLPAETANDAYGPKIER